MHISFRVLLVILAVVFNACQQASNDHAKQPVTSVPVKKVSIAEIEVGIKKYILEKAEKNSGYFQVADRGKDFKMKLVRVHTEYLANLGPKRHFACVDLADVSGDVYDVDFFMNGEPGAMDVTETTVHKLNGKPYYAWKQK